MSQSLDIAPGGEQYLPYAQHLMRALKATLVANGQRQGRMHTLTPDGGAFVYLRTQRGGPELSVTQYAPRGQPIEWYDHIKIEAEFLGYIFDPFINRLLTGGDAVPLSSLLNVRDKLPYSGYRFKEIPGLNYAYPMPNRYGSPNGAGLVATYIRRLNSKRGYYLNGDFAEFDGTVIDPSERIKTVFRHTYDEVISGDERTVILGIYGVGSSTLESGVMDMTTGNILTLGAGYGGSFVSSNITTQVSRDGRVAVISAISNAYPAALLKKFRLDINFTGLNQVEVTDITEAAPSVITTTGSSSSERWVNNVVQHVVGATVVSADGDYSDTTTSGFDTTGEVTSPVAFGVNAGGDTVQVSAKERWDIHQSTSNATTWSGSGPLFPTAGTSEYQTDNQNVTINSGDGHHVVITLPGGASASFPISRTNSSEVTTRTSHTTQVHVSGWGAGSTSVTTAGQTYTKNSEVIDGTLKIIYVDPTIPFLVYEHFTDRTIVSQTESGGSSLSYRNIEYGVLSGNEHRILFTDHGAETLQTLPPLAPYNGAAAFPDGTLQASFETSSSNTQTSNPGAAAFRKTPRHIVPIVNGPSFRTDTRYSVAARDAKNWVVNITRFRTVNNVAVNEFRVFTSRLDDAKVRAKFIERLIEATADSPSLATVHNDLVDGNLAPYEIRMMTQRFETTNDGVASYL